MSTALSSENTGICPVILSGGSGSRLWPLSRELTPKQLLPLSCSNTLLQETLQRIDSVQHLSTPSIIICHEQHRFQVLEQIHQIGKSKATIILEPVTRNTAPALTLAALSLIKSNLDAVMLVLPADHVIGKITEFQRVISLAYAQLGDNKLMAFGIKPAYAETGYGYIKLGKCIADDIHTMSAFVEKPDLDTAQNYVQSADYLWNSGMFMMKASTWLQQLATQQPDMLEICRLAFDKGSQDNDCYRVDKTQFSRNKSESIDTVVMEKISNNNGIVMTLDAAWSDIGSWSALWDIGKKDENGNVCLGDTYLSDTYNSFIHSNKRFIATLGLENTIVVDTADSILVANKNHSQQVKKIVNWLKQQQRAEQHNHQRVYRPWGYYEQIDRGDCFQVKRLSVKPDATLSLQFHQHRAEHWIVIKGTATVTRGDENYLVLENQSTYIPLGVKHRLENQGSIPLEMIEVQSGHYLGEDDIVRCDDNYGRVN